MADIGFFIPGDPNQKTGGYLYNRKILEAWNKAGYSCKMVSIPYTGKLIPQKTKDEIRYAIKSSGVNTIILDGLAGAWIAEIIREFNESKKFIYLEHLPLKEHFPAEKTAIEACTRVIVTSQYAKQLLESRGVNKLIQVVEPGDSTEGFRIKEVYNKKARHLIFVGSLSPRKDPKAILNALSSIPGDWNLDICGAWSIDELYPSETINLAYSLFPDGNVRFFNGIEQEELYQKMIQSDLLVSCSKEETYGMAVAEALSLGLPVLANNIGAFKTVFGDRLLYYSGFEELKTILAQALMKPEYYSGMIQQTVEGKAFPSWNQQAEKFWNIINS